MNFTTEMHLSSLTCTILHLRKPTTVSRERPNSYINTAESPTRVLDQPFSRTAIPNLFPSHQFSRFKWPRNQGLPFFHHFSRTPPPPPRPLLFSSPGGLKRLAPLYEVVDCLRIAFLQQHMQLTGISCWWTCHWIAGPLRNNLLCHCRLFDATHNHMEDNIFCVVWYINRPTLNKPFVYPHFFN